MIIVLDGETLVTLLVDMTESTRLIVRMIAHRVRAANPLHEATHLAVHERPQDQVIVIRHQLVAE